MSMHPVKKSKILALLFLSWLAKAPIPVCGQAAPSAAPPNLTLPFKSDEMLRSVHIEPDTRAWLKVIQEGEEEVRNHQWQAAEESFRRSLELARQGPPAIKIAVSLIDLGGVYDTEGEYAKVFPLWDEAYP